MDFEVRLPARYRVRRAIGKGGMGVVVEAHDEVLDRVVAVKQIKVADFSDEAGARFQKEIEGLSRIEHPGIVRLLDAGVEDDQPYMVMERLEGRSLALSRAAGSLGAAHVREILVAVLEALAAVHAAGILHRDLSPGNVFLDDHRGPVLIDFGLVREAHPTTMFSRTGVVVGTLRYMAPEVVGSQSYSAQSDLFAVAAIGFDALTAVDLHSGEPSGSPAAIDVILSALASSTYMDVAARVLGGRGPLGDVLLKNLHHDRDRRSGSAEDFRDELERLTEEDLAAWDASRDLPPPGEATAVLPRPEDSGGGDAAGAARVPPGRLLAVSGAIAGALLLAGWGVLGGGSRPEPAPSPTEGTTGEPASGSPAPSPARSRVDLLRFVEDHRALPVLRRQLAGVLAADPGDAPARAARVLEDSSLRALERTGRVAAPLPLLPAQGVDPDAWSLYTRVVTWHVLERVQTGGEAGEGPILGLLPEDFATGIRVPEGRVFRADLRDLPGLFAHHPDETPGVQVALYAGRRQARLKLEIELEGVDRATRSYVRVRGRELGPRDGLAVTLSFWGNVATVITLPPPGVDHMTTGSLPAALWREGKNPVVITLLPLDGYERTIERLEEFEVVLVP